jgi:hypothetical protein
MPLSPEQKRALAARVDYYRDLGIHSFYRRREAPIADVGARPALSEVERAASPAKKYAEDSRVLRILCS